MATNSRQLIQPRRLPRIAVYGVAALLALVVLGLIIIDKLSSPPHLEKRIAAIIGPEYIVDIGKAKYNPFRGTFNAEYIAVEPDTARYKEPRRETWNFTATAIRVEGIRHWGLYKKNVDVERIQFDTPRLRVYLDRHVAPEQLHRPSILPQEHLRRLDKRLRIGTIEVTNGEIVFRERALDGVRPGEFVFADISAMVTNITNDPDRMSMPCSIDVHARLADSAAMRAIVAYNLASDSLDLSYEGGIGKMDATLLNDLVVNLNGIHVRGGTIDSTWFDVSVDDDIASGKVQCLYRGLEFELLDKNSHEQNLGDELATFLKESRDANPHEPDEPPMTASLYRRREPDDNVVKFVWVTVRDGLLKTLGMVD